MQTRYRIHNNKTYLEPVIICQEYWHREVNKLACTLVVMMGEDGYSAWCDVNLPNGPVDWRHLYELLEAKLNAELALRELETQDHQDDMREGRPL